MSRLRILTRARLHFAAAILSFLFFRTAAAPCAAGTFGSGTSGCTACPKGKHAPNPGTLSCLPKAGECAGVIPSYVELGTLYDVADGTSVDAGGRSSDDKWNRVVAARNGKIYGVPFQSTGVLEIDPATDTTSLFATSPLLGLSKWSGGVLAPNDKIYCIPGNEGAVLVIDPDTRTTNTFGDLSSGSSKWVGGVLAPNGKIYGIPYNAVAVLVINPGSHTASPLSHDLGSAGGKYNGGVLAPNGLIYAVPRESTHVLAIDPATNTTFTFGTLSGTIKWSDGALAPNGKIYGIPFNSRTVLAIDPTSNTTSTFGNLPGSMKWAGGVLAPNGKIYCIPFDSAAVLVIDPATDTVVTFGSVGVGGQKWIGGALASSGKIYGIPSKKTAVLVIGVATCRCGNGTRHVTNASACGACVSGYFADSTALLGPAACTACPRGKYGAGPRSNTCSACLAGTFGDEAGQDETYTCKDCAKGRFQLAPGSATCIDCPEGEFQDITRQTSCKPCIAGKHRTAFSATHAEGDACSTCPSGQFQNETRQLQCKACAPGRQRTDVGLPLDESAACAACASGRYQDQSAQTDCVDCKAGQFEPRVGSTACTDCDLGTRAPNASASTGCEDCAPGWFSDTRGQTTCKRCSEGRYQPNAGHESCFLCSSDSAQNETGQTSCTACAVGKSSVGTGGRQCTPGAACAAGRFGVPGACADCAAGQYQSRAGQRSCEACPSGTHQPAAGQVSCVGCESGRFRTNTSAASPADVACAGCRAGRFQDAKAQLACKPCQVGTEQPALNSSACRPCDTLMWSLAGSAFCRSCDEPDRPSAQCDIFQPSAAEAATGRATVAGGALPAPASLESEFGDLFDAACATDSQREVDTAGRLISDDNFSLITAAVGGVGLILFLCHPLLPHRLLRKTDRFACEHLLAELEPVRNVVTLLGGAATILLGAAMLCVAAFYLSEPNVIVTKGVVPAQDTPGVTAYNAPVLGISVVAYTHLGSVSNAGGCTRPSNGDAWTVIESGAANACRYRWLDHGKVSVVGLRQLPVLQDLHWSFQRFDITLFVPNATLPGCPRLAAQHTLRREGATAMLGEQEVRFAMLPHVRAALATQTVGFLSNFKAATSDAAPQAAVVQSDTVSLRITLERDTFALVEREESKLGIAQLLGVMFSSMSTVYIFACFVWKFAEKPLYYFFRRLYKSYPAPPAHVTLGAAGLSVSEKGVAQSAEADAAHPSLIRTYSDNPMHDPQAKRLAMLEKQLQQQQEQLQQVQQLLQASLPSAGKAGRTGAPADTHFSVGMAPRNRHESTEVSGTNT